MKKILLDTSFLVHCCNKKVDFVSEFERLYGSFELFIIDKIIDELNKIVRTDKKFKFSAMLSKSVIEALKVKILTTKENLLVDELLLKSALDNKFVLATHDKELKRKAIEKKLEIVYLRQEKYLETNSL